MTIALAGLRPQKIRTLGVSPSLPHQSMVQDQLTGEWYVAQVWGTKDANDVESFRIYRCKPDGTVVDFALIQSGGHGTSITLEHDAGSVYIWFGFPNKGRVRFKYTGTATGKNIAWGDASLQQVGVGIDTSYCVYAIDERADRVATQRQDTSGGTNSQVFTLRKLSEYKAGTNNILNTVSVVQDDIGAFQGFTTIDDQLFVWRGGSNYANDTPPHLYCYNWATGARTDMDCSDISTDAGRIEAEGICAWRNADATATVILGIASGTTGGTQKATVYQLVSKSLASRVGTGGTVTLHLDIDRITGKDFTDGEVTVSYDREVIRTGTAGITPARLGETIRLTSGDDTVEVIASDDPDLLAESKGFVINVSVSWSDKTGRGGEQRFTAQASVNADDVNLSEILL